ncbi:MAG: CBS domain-containing protein [Planctomycetota bacterium]|jgi:CBS domain-containing protein
MSNELRKLRAADVMTKTVHWAKADETLRAAAQRMQQHHVRALLVAGPDPSDLPGILTTKDIVSLFGSHPLEVLDHTTVGDVMTRPAICVPQQANLVDCIQLMRTAGVRRLPVLDGTKVVGVLSSTDVFARALA